jgi:hypothetical protein
VTVVGAGGIRFAKYTATKQFARQFRKLEPQLKARARAALNGLMQYPIPSGIRFEKLGGYADPDIYTIHVTGNFKISLHAARIDLGHDRGIVLQAVLRKVGPHDEIDRAP